jgi:hypothetical protein
LSDLRERTIAALKEGADPAVVLLLDWLVADLTSTPTVSCETNHINVDLTNMQREEIARLRDELSIVRMKVSGLESRNGCLEGCHDLDQKEIARLNAEIDRLAQANASPSIDPNAAPWDTRLVDKDEADELEANFVAELGLEPEVRNEQSKSDPSRDPESRVVTGETPNGAAASVDSTDGKSPSGEPSLTAGTAEEDVHRALAAGCRTQREISDWTALKCQFRREVPTVSQALGKLIRRGLVRQTSEQDRTTKTPGTYELCDSMPPVADESIAPICSRSTCRKEATELDEDGAALCSDCYRKTVQARNAAATMTLVVAPEVPKPSGQIRRVQIVQPWKASYSPADLIHAIEIFADASVPANEDSRAVKECHMSLSQARSVRINYRKEIAMVRTSGSSRAAALAELKRLFDARAKAATG